MQGLEGFRIDAQIAEMGVSQDSVRKQGFAIIVELRSSSISHDTEVCPLGIHAHDSAITAVKEVQLHAAIQCRGRAKVGLKRDVLVTSRRSAREARVPRRYGMSSIGADNSCLRPITPQAGGDLFLLGYFVYGLILKNFHPACPGMFEQRLVK